MDMRQDALRQAKAVFVESRDEIFSAIEVINEILEYAKKEGLLALSQDKFFRQEELHILDAIEEKGKKVPLKQYLSYALEHVSNGEELELLDVFMENRYFANSYTGKEAYISYIYLIGITSIAQGLNFGQLLLCFRSLIPDSETESFEKFAAKWELCGKGAKRIGTVIRFGQKGE